MKTEVAKRTFEVQYVNVKDEPKIQTNIYIFSELEDVMLIAQCTRTYELTYGRAFIVVHIYSRLKITYY